LKYNSTPYTSRGTPFGIVAFIVMAVGAEALWLGPIGRWLLHLF
jgi:hypothetical protein